LKAQYGNGPIFGGASRGAGQVPIPTHASVARCRNHGPATLARQTAPTVDDKVEAAYRRSDMREKRRRMMADWAAYCISKNNAIHVG